MSNHWTQGYNNDDSARLEKDEHLIKCDVAGCVNEGVHNIGGEWHLCDECKKDADTIVEDESGVDGVSSRLNEN